MYLKSDILKIVNIQQNSFKTNKSGIYREVMNKLFEDKFQLLAISGLLNSGKSTLLFQLFQEKFPDVLYINFAHPRFYNFDTNDLFKLDEIIAETGSKTLFFDEIQNLNSWSAYVSEKLEDGYKVVVTGSNTTILSNDVNIEGPGLNKTIELFPFSFNEFCLFQDIDRNEEATLKYITKGGLPGYLNADKEEYLNQFFEDLLVRVLAVKFGIRDLRAFKRLAIHLLSNSGKYITGNQLKSHLGIKTTSTVMDYLSFLETGYLFFYVPKFSYSVRKQMINPRKVYAVDTGLIQANSASFEDSKEGLFENMVFLHLRRQFAELYYYSDNFHCDFVLMKKNRIAQAVQVCSELKQDNLDIELSGLFEAMDFFELDEGTIVTMNQTDHFLRLYGKVIQVLPFHSFAKEVV